MTVCVWKRIPCQLRASSVAVCIKSVSMGKFPQHEEMAFQGCWRSSSNGFSLFQETAQPLWRKCTAASVTSQQFCVKIKPRWGSFLNLQMLSLFVLNSVWRWFFWWVFFFCVCVCKAGKKSDHQYQGTTDVRTTLENFWKNNHCFRTSLLLVWMMTCFSFNIPFEQVFMFFSLIIDPCAALAFSGGLAIKQY